MNNVPEQMIQSSAKRAYDKEKKRVRKSYRIKGGHKRNCSDCLWIWPESIGSYMCMMGDIPVVPGGYCRSFDPK